MNLDRRKLMLLSAAALAAPVFKPYVARAAGKKLRIGHTNSPTSALQVASTVFQKYLVEKTAGRYDVEIFPSSQLGSDTQLVQSVADGTLDMTISASAILGVYNRDIELVGLPYLFKDLQSARKALDGDLGAHYAEQLLKSSLTNIGWGENGMRHVGANKPIRTVADMKGLKIRVQPSKILVESFTGLGAMPAPLAFSDLEEALRTGRFEAQENPISIVTSNPFIPKYQSHLSLTSHVYSPLAVNFSSDVFDDMAPADRAFVKAGGLMAVKATRDFTENAVATGLQQLKSGGMTIVTDVDTASFQTAMESMNDRLIAVVGADAMKRVRGMIA